MIAKVVRSGIFRPGLLFAVTLLCVGVIIGILFFMVTLGLPVFSSGSSVQVMFGRWAPDRGLFGISAFVAGTLWLVGLSFILAFPLSLGNALLIYLLLPPRPANLLHRLVRMMTGIPTVIYGFIGVVLLVPIVREWFGTGSGMSMLSAALLLALLISPTMILVFVESFAAVPRSDMLALSALGGSMRQKFLVILMPGAADGMLAGIILALGRALGDTMIALMVAGNATMPPQSLLDPVRTLTAHIALVIAADFDSIEFRTIFICGVVLYLWSAILTLILRLLHRKTVSFTFD